MKTKFRVDAKIYIDCEGKYTGWAESKTYYETIEEARANAENIKPGYVNEGSWKIVKRTINENTFAVEEETVEEHKYDWWANH